MQICKRFVVSGRVQGVWYRASTQQQAKELEIKGYARNLPDGSVEVMACGSQDNINKLHNWLRQGPSNAKVSTVLIEDAKYRNLSSFETL